MHTSIHPYLRSLAGVVFANALPFLQHHSAFELLCMQACQVESDATAVSAYIVFLAHHSSQFDIHDLDALALVCTGLACF